MPKNLGILYLLLASSHSCLQTKQNHDDEKDESKDVISCSDPVSDLKIYSPVSETEVGGNVTLECKSTVRCLPINYTLFLKKDKALRHATKNREEERIVFNFTINSTSELGEYKCRAQTRFNDAVKYKYSRGFNFTLREAAAEEKNKLVVFIVAPLLLLLLLIVIAVAIPLMILPWCKAKNQKPASKSTHYTPANHLSSEACATYEDVAFHGKSEEVEYCNLNIGTTERDCRERILTEDSTVSYAEIVVRR